MAQRESGKARRAARRSLALGNVLDATRVPGQQTGMAEHELLLAERDAALHEAFTRLPPSCQRLIAMLIEDPPCRTLRSAPSWASRSAASGQAAAAAWKSYAAIRRSLP